MTYICDVFLAQSWKDDRLLLPVNMTSESRLLPAEWLADMWRPDLYIENAREITPHTLPVPNHYLWLYKDKSILYQTKLTLVLTCPMDFRAYPQDTQTCKIKMESVSHTTDDLIFAWDPNRPVHVDSWIEPPRFDLTNTSTSDCTTIYPE